VASVHKVRCAAQASIAVVILLIAGQAEVACTPVALNGPVTGRVERLALVPCHLNYLSEEVRCGVHEVFEDRGAKTGRRIPISVAVLPALRRTTHPDPLFMLAGGPGQGARDLGAVAARFFKQVRRTREIVLVDLRGTGASHALTCPVPDDELEKVQADVDSKACRRQLDADPTQYTHKNALADLDEVRQRLGYQQINLWGGSWGTRAALLYALTYPQAVRSVVLDGAVALDLDFPRTVAGDAQRALDQLIEACRRVQACGAAFPRIRPTVEALLAKFDRGPFDITVRHPRTGAMVSISLRQEALIEIIRAALYTTADTTRLLQVLRHAVRGDFSPVMALSARSASLTSDTMAVGATMSILCSEDWPGAAGVDFDAGARGTLFRSGYVEAWRARCDGWPTGEGIGLARGATANAPALILSGDRDPVTPPARGEQMARHFPHSQHVVVPGAAHNASFTGCVPDLIAAFLDTRDTGALDATCAKRTRFPPSVTGDAGAHP
jgi:pimeloyl-ACP methyl ester carboxylesterase